MWVGSNPLSKLGRYAPHKHATAVGPKNTGEAFSPGSSSASEDCNPQRTGSHGSDRPSRLPPRGIRDTNFATGGAEQSADPIGCGKIHCFGRHGHGQKPQKYRRIGAKKPLRFGEPLTPNFIANRKSRNAIYCGSLIASDPVRNAPSTT